jgi:hypothetical protein
MAAQAADLDYPNQFFLGFDVVGPVAQGHEWPPLATEAPMPIQEMESRAWDIRDRVEHRHRAVTDIERTVWQTTLEETQKGYCAGPFYRHSQVDEIVGTKHWIATPRFGIQQGSKIRGIDSATESLVNQATQVSEKLQLASVDTAVAVAKLLAQQGKAELGAWVLDETDAYRQIPVKPAQRRYGVVALPDPEGRVAFFVMYTHSFGWTSAVYNYNRRSKGIDLIPGIRKRRSRQGGDHPWSRGSPRPAARQSSAQKEDGLAE